MASTVNCCWNNDQNTADPTNSGINEITRLRSVGVICFEAPMTINSATAAIIVRITTTSERFSAVKMPSSTANTMTTTAATPINDQRTASCRLSGFIGLRLDSVMVMPHQPVLHQPDKHHHGGQAKAPMEAFPTPHRRG